MFRDNVRWVLEYDDAMLYDDLAGHICSTGLQAIDAFCIVQTSGPPREAAELGGIPETGPSMAASPELCLERVAIRDLDAHAEVRTGACGGMADKR